MFVTNSLTGGGAERAMNLASNELSRRHWPIAHVPINASAPDFVKLVCEVFPLGRKWQGGLGATIVAFLRFHRIVYSWDPDVIIMTCDLPEFFGACLISRRKLVIVEEASFPWGTRVRFGKVIRKLLNFRGVTTVAASPHLKIWPNNNPPHIVIQNAITPYENLAISSPKNTRLNRLIYIGRLSPEKRPEWFISVCQMGNFKGSIIGDGTLRESLLNVVRSKKISVDFAGFLLEPWAALGRGDIVIVPSLFEGDGLVVIEALKHGVPILLADIADFRRFGLPEINYCQDVDSFVERIRKFQGDIETLIVPVKTSVEILSSRSPISVGDRWESFLNSI